MYKYLKNLVKEIVIFFLQIRVIYILKNINFKNKKNIFIDLGTNKGQGFFFFKKFFKIENFEYLLIEPNPNLKNFINQNIINKYKNNKISFLSKAAYIQNTKKKFFGLVEDDRGALSEGASILKDHNSNMYDANEEKSIYVDCFDFPEYLKKLKDYDNIVIKMDVEGSEYILLEKIIENITEIQNIKHIFIEFHSRFMNKSLKKKFRLKEIHIKDSLKKNKINFTLWI